MDTRGAMRRIYILLLLVGISVSACNFFTQPTDLQTENLENEIAATQIAQVRETATVNADRLLITLEYAQTAVRDVEIRSTRIASTLVASGMLFVDASGLTLVPETEEAGASAGSTPAMAERFVTPVVSGQGSARSNIPIQEPPTPTPIATADPSMPTLTNLTLTERVGADDCPIGASTSFTTNTTDIYATAVAHNLGPSNVVMSTWTRDGAQAAFYEWSPNFEISEACIWFHLPASAVEFVPGNWSVQLALDGAPVGSPLTFTITGNSPTEMELGDTGEG